ncbi:MAG: hypothetical protein A3F70_01925 [Acidobacteria bacterium RIFCSPLOWO2_12_FULL_67_14]|nr:MAG: hypothetical protein A3F70_01925 [Acidobacteria bacterium RIFCSPLOWO2_12_FULL_67_14]
MRVPALVLVVVLAWATAGRALQNTARERPPTLILVSIDGWRWDYAQKAPAPNLRRLIDRGVSAENLIPSFPSKTFPNHYTIVTGLYPGRHGIVGNAIRDPESGRTFTRTSTRELRDPMWWGGEPIWVTVQRAGRPAATMFWVGSEAPIHGMLPRFWKAYDERYPPNDRVDQVLRWLDLPAGERPAFLALYFSNVDSAGHAGGPDSTEAREAIRTADGYLGRLMRGLERRRLTASTNIVVVSDHGMVAVNARDVVVLDDYVGPDDIDVVDINPTLGLFPKTGEEDDVYRALAAAHPRLKVYRRETTPEHWQYRDHPRIPPIVGVADEGWQVLRRGAIDAIRTKGVPGDGGQHGYDPELMSMRGIFVAAGPAFKRGVTVPAFKNVHIYELLARVLHVEPAPNDGDPAVARSLMR